MTDMSQEGQPLVLKDTASERVSYSLLDQSLWNEFREAKGPVEFVTAWLGLQCRQIRGVQAAVVVLGTPETGPYSPAASWPDKTPNRPELMNAAEQAMSKRQGVMVPPGPNGDTALALPIVVDEALFGTVSIVVAKGGLSNTEAIRNLRWGVGWLEALLRREQGARDAALRDRTAKALEYLSVVLSSKRIDEACTALVTELASSLKCDPVSIGFLRRKRVKVKAVSHASGFGGRMNLIRDIGLAMDEAVDQGDLVLFPRPDNWEYRVTRMHEDLARTHKTGVVLTIPMQADGRIIGAITLERPADRPFDDETVELCDVVATMVGPVLEEKRLNDRMLIVKLFEVLGNQLKRLLGPRYFGRKIATLVLAALIYLGATVTGEFTISAPARVEGSVQRTIVAPFNGYLATESVRSGEEVAAGEIMATLNDQDLVLEELRWDTARNQREIEYDRALATRERAAAAIIKSQIAQAEAQLALIQEQLSRTRIIAPFDGIVVEGDLSQSVGASIERGQVLFRIAPLEAYRVVLEVDEGDVAEVAPGQTGVLRLSSRPDTSLEYTVERITPVAQQQDGRNFFRVEATLVGDTDWVRPSMEGAARISVDERLVVDIWTRRLVNWARLAFWRFAP